MIIDCPIMHGSTTAVYGPGSSTMAFTWDADASATSYRVEFGSSSGASDRGTSTVTAPTTTLQILLLTGTYYMRVRTMVGASPGAASPDQVVIVT